LCRSRNLPIFVQSPLRRLCTKIGPKRTLHKNSRSCTKIGGRVEWGGGQTGRQEALAHLAPLAQRQAQDAFLLDRQIHALRAEVVHVGCEHPWPDKARPQDVLATEVPRTEHAGMSCGLRAPVLRVVAEQACLRHRAHPALPGRAYDANRARACTGSIRAGRAGAIGG
jgi:hypothetical protein